MEYDVVIGLEVHSELKTKSKVFCGCKNEFGGEPNSHCCPVCIGLPGALPIPNKEAVKMTIKAGLAVGSEINDIAIFERKNYFYPDLAKAYQISQAVRPICVGGGVEIETEQGQKKFIRLNRIHLEEDAGKLIHNSKIGATMVDYNRGGVPLIEIVSEPDMSSAEEAVAYLSKLRNILQYIEVSDCKMEQGSLRCDVNISLKPKGSNELGVRAEMKNLNSFRSVSRAIEYEIKRQSRLLDEGEEVVQETRRWDDARNRSFSMRRKEDAQDYRYFPDPDLLPFKIERSLVDEVKKSMPKLREEKIQIYVNEMGLSEYDAQVLTNDLNLVKYFDKVISYFNKPKFVCNFILSTLLKKVKENESTDLIIPIDAENFANLLSMYESGEISQAICRELFDEIWENEQDCKKLVEERGLRQNNNEDEIKVMIESLINEFPQSVADYKAGNAKALSFFVGQLMKRTQGKANAQIASKLIKEMLND